MKRIARHDAEGKKMIRLIVKLAYDLAQRRTEYNIARTQVTELTRLKSLAELDYLRLQQIEVIENRLIPVASLKKEFFEDKITLFSLKIEWFENAQPRIKNVNTVGDKMLNNICTAIEESIYRGDTLAQILTTAETGVRTFTKTPVIGKVPLWVKQWEETDYELNFIPPAFSVWANIKDF